MIYALHDMKAYGIMALTNKKYFRIIVEQRKRIIHFARNFM